VTTRDRRCEKDPPRKRSREPIRESEVSVRFEESRRRPPERGRKHHWARNVAARAEHDVRPAPAKDPQTRSRSDRRRRQGASERDSGLPRQSRAAKRVELVAGLRNE